MHEAIPVFESSSTAAISIEETPSADDNCARVAAEATPRTYFALTERPADFTEIFVPIRRQFFAAAATYKALKQPPSDFNRLDLLAPPRRHSAEQAFPTYRALTEPTADFTEILAVPEIMVIPEIVATPQELESLSNQATEQADSSGKKPLIEPPVGFARRETSYTPTHHPRVVARRSQSAD
jgi:hypothetical protein